MKKGRVTLQVVRKNLPGDSHDIVTKSITISRRYQLIMYRREDLDHGVVQSHHPARCSCHWIYDCEYVDERERKDFCEEVQELVGSDS